MNVLIPLSFSEDLSIGSTRLKDGRSEEQMITDN
jgi:hypothetical protein